AVGGSPVFVRQSSDERLSASPPRRDLFLLGVLQASWGAPRSHILAADRNGPIVVPPGIGVVVPSDRIVEVLEMPVFKKPRDELNRRRRLVHGALTSA
ncbi:MAG: hypothetical protein ACRELF_22905, partial [Gemmataceae bacterium]